METTRRSPFGIALRQLREAAGLSQEQLAERAGLSSRGISDLERGARTTPRPETVRMLAEALDLDDAKRNELLAVRNSSSHHTSGHAVQEPRGLPVPTTSFIGRIREIDESIRILMNDGARLLTLTGAGGVGKTRVAIKVAHRLEEKFAYGATFVDLSTVRKPNLVVTAIADKLGIHGQPLVDIRDVIEVALQNRSLLLVLDNLEQVIDAATDIAWLLGACPGVTIIATSRVRLRIAAEYVMPIEPLGLPAHHDVAVMERAEAVELFVARARAVDHRFSVGAEQAPTVAAIVNQLQGMPLAIELAAARLRLFSVSDLLERLNAPLLLLSGASRDAPERHRTMRDTIAWSYKLLSPPEQMVFRTVSIFPDGCTLETAVAVLKFDSRLDEVQTFAAMESLVDSSLLRRGDDVDGQARYRMLQTLQEFGQEQLKAAGEEQSVRRAAHVAWCEPLARKAEFVRARPDAFYWLRRIRAEYQNLRAHVAWLIKHDYMAEALDISGSLAAFRGIGGYFDEGRLELEMLLANPQNQAETLIRMRGLLGLGVICTQQADSERSFPALEVGARIARELGEQWHLARALLGLGQSMAVIGQLEKAETLTKEGMSVGMAMGDKFFIAGGPPNLGLILDQRGDLDQAYELIQASLTASVSFGSLWDVAIGTLNLGYMNLRRGDIDSAEGLILEAEQLFLELGDQRDLPIASLYLADIARVRGDLATAEYRLEQALGIAREIGGILDIAHSYSGLAQISRINGDLTTSQSHTCSAIRWYERCGNTVDAVRCLDNLADLAIASGEPARAAWCIGAVDAVLSDRGMTRTELIPGEHKTRVASVKATLGEEIWHQHHGRGHSMSAGAILAEVKSWLSCHTSAMATLTASGQTAQRDYDNGTR